MPATAYAQSTGSVEFEKQTIVITGTRTKEVGGVQNPDTPKAKVVLTQEMIARQNPGQTILDTINLVPGVSFQNNDAYGSSGGTLNIRGFDSSRISLTFDGIQLNDSGNYAIFSNQMIDPELIEQVNVNLGSTDVDSPTASAVGGTVNLRTITPSKTMGARIVGSIGTYDFRRIFGLFQTGEIGPWGTRAWIAASKAQNANPFNNYGVVDKKQINGKIWQPIGANGDFVAIAGHYNQNRNNFFGSLPLRIDTAGNRVVGPNAQNRYPRNRHERFYDINYPCNLATGHNGVADPVAPGIDPRTGAVSSQFASCGTEFDRRYNPSNTGNIRGSSKFTIRDGLVLTVDPSVQFVKANGGGTVTAQEGLRDINPTDPPGSEGATSTPAQCALGNTSFRTCVSGFYGGSPFFGRDINGDGDSLDAVTVLAPSQTKTFRPGVIAGLRWDINPDNLVRFSYTLDWARHRQTGEVGLLKQNGEPTDVFPRNDPQLDTTGTILEKRDRLSFAILHRFAGEYVGHFGKATVNVGLAFPYFLRRLHNYCFTSSASGFVECSGRDPVRDAQIALLNPYTFNPTTGAVTGFAPPQERRFTYKKLLPNIGAVYDFTSRLGIFANFAKGLSVPSTDNLYNSFFFPQNTTAGDPKPETTDSFDGGIRYRTSKVQAQLSGWFTRFNNRTASAFDPELNVSVFRNLGRVDKYGIDGSIAYEPIKEVTLYVFGSAMRSKIKDNIQIGSFPVGGPNQITDCDNIPAGALASNIIKSCAFTKGNWESGTPKYTFGFSGVGRTKWGLELGFEAKRTGPRYIFDNNRPVFATGVNLTNLNDVNAANDPAEVFPAKAPAYWLVNLDVRYNLAPFGPELKNTYLQLNVYNLFDKFYVGGFGGGLAQAFNTAGTQYGNPPFVQIGAPRTIMGSINIGF
jgi:iron complex outermembrane receptor protein